MEYGQLERALGELGIEQDAAEYHGGVCGAVCADTDTAFLEEADRSRSKPLTDKLRGECEQQLLDQASNFQPLLPDDDTDLAGRVEALAAWCSGFMSGLAGLGSRLRKAAPEVREVVRDLTEISRAEPSSEAAPDEDEQAYAELVEYVRVGAQLVFLEFHSSQAGTRVLQ